MKTTYLRIKPLALAIAALGATFANPAAAFKFEMENGITGSFDSTISFGAQVRMQLTDKSIIGNDNGGNVATVGDLGVKVNGPGFGATSNPDFNYLQTDDGNLNYKRHDIVSAVFKGTHELFLTQKGNWSALGRFTWSTDLRADNTQRTPLHSDAEDAMEKNISLLDFWVAKEFKLGDNSAKVKLGNQVMNWGEDIFIIGGVNAVNAFDLRKIHIPGVQLKEVFIPAPMISFSSGSRQRLFDRSLLPVPLEQFRIRSGGYLLVFCRLHRQGRQAWRVHSVFTSWFACWYCWRLQSQDSGCAGPNHPQCISGNRPG